MDQQTSQVASSATEEPKAKGPTRTKNRPQQSCNQCRERKVKCDRAKPCRACCIRGQESECEYVTNNEDRFQISQADVIERLRKEVSRLKRDLADAEQSNQFQLVRPGETGAGVPQRNVQRIAHSSPSGPWGVIPAMGTTTRMVTSEPPNNGIANTGQLNWSDGAALETTAPPTTSSIVQPPDNVYNDSWLSGDPLAGSGYYDPTTSMPLSDGIPNPHFVSTAQGSLLPDQSEYFTGENWTSCPPAGHHGDSWKGKHEILQTLLNAICNCDDSRIGHIIDIVRNSATPEDAVATICQEVMPTDPVLSV